MSSCFSRCLRVPIAIRAFYESYLWILQTLLLRHPDLHPGLLREEKPGVYESYVDIVAGAWTRIKIVVSGTKAQVYVNGADQPCLIVNDLKLGESHGQ